MPWESKKLNSGGCLFRRIRTSADKVVRMSGYYIPSIGFGTWTLGNGQGPIDQVEQALENGYNHIGESRHLAAAAYVDVYPIP